MSSAGGGGRWIVTCKASIRNSLVSCVPEADLQSKKNSQRWQSKGWEQSGGGPKVEVRTEEEGGPNSETKVRCLSAGWLAVWGSCSECGSKARPNAEKLQFPGGCVWAPQRIFSGLRFGVSPPRERGSSTAFKVMLGFKFPSLAAYADMPLSSCRVIELHANRRTCRSSAKLRRSLPPLVGASLQSCTL